MGERLRLLLPLFGAILGAIMTFAMLVVALIFSDMAIGATILAILFGLGAAFCGVLAFQQFRHRQDNLLVSGMGQEKNRILKLAEREEGYLTAEEAAMECHISVQQAEALLDDMVNQGRAETWVSDGGSMVYVFRNFLEDKESAEDPLKVLEP